MKTFKNDVHIFLEGYYRVAVGNIARIGLVTQDVFLKRNIEFINKNE